MHILKVEITTPGKANASMKENKLLFHCFQLKDHPFLKLSSVSWPEPLFPLLSWGSKGVTITDGVLRWKPLLGGAEGGNLEGERPSYQLTTGLLTVGVSPSISD